jgi:hypothetical protein
MVRTQIYLTEKERAGLEALSEASGKKQSELIREAVDHSLGENSKTRRATILECAAGMWKNRKNLPGFGAMRAEWDRK